MEVLLTEARESYDEEIVVVLSSNTPDEMDSNVERIRSWNESWQKDNEAVSS
jgi:adenylate kinase